MCIEAYIHSHSYTARDLNEKRQEIDSLDLYNWLRDKHCNSNTIQEAWMFERIIYVNNNYIKSFKTLFLQIAAIVTPSFSLLWRLFLLYCNYFIASESDLNNMTGF